MEKKKIINVLNGKREKNPPIWFMRQAGRYLPEYRQLRKQKDNFIDFCFDKKSIIEASLQPLKRFDIDAAIIFSDILLVPYALGSQVSFEENVGPILVPFDENTKLNFSPSHFSKKLDVVYESLDSIASSLESHQSLIGFAGAPWTLAAYMIEGRTSRDFLKARLWSINNPELFSRLMNTLIEATAEHLINQIKAGADCIQIFDSWAGCLSPSLFEDYCLNPISKVIGKIRTQCPQAKVIVFAKGCGVLYESLALKSGADAVSCDSTLPPTWLAKYVQPHGAIQGTLDPLLLLTGGERMKEETRSIIASLDKGGHIFNCGHGILPHTPPSHVEELVKIVKGI